MKKLLLSTALAVILTSPAIAEEKSITIVCSDDVEKGTVVLSDPPKMSCEDFDLASRYVGSGFSIGPDTTIEDVKAFLAKWVVRQEQKKKQKLKTQLELVKECKRVPRINPPPVEFAELINMCMKVGVMSTASFDDRPDASISYWTVLKDGWKKENPDRPVFEGK